MNSLFAFNAAFSMVYLFLAAYLLSNQIKGTTNDNN